MTREVVNKSPTRKTLVTGQSLPAITTESRPIPVGRDEDGEPDSQVRAFAILIRNRADSVVYVREGATDDENRIDPGESFHIWEPDGVNDVLIRGAQGGENVEFRTLEAHNDFSITDKIDAFSRALSHFFGTSTRTTEITGDVTVGTIDDGVDATIIGSDIDVPVSGTVDIGQFADTVEISDIAASSATFDVTGSVDIGQITDGIDVDSIPNVTVGTINDGIDVDSLPNVDIDTINDGIDVDDGNITVDDITAASVDFDGAITDIDLSPAEQTNDLSAATREGRTVTEKADIEGASIGTFDSQLNQTIAEFYNYEFRTNATYDGRIERIEVRLYDDNGTPVEDVGFILKIDDGSGYRDVSPRATWRADFARDFGADTVRTPTFYPEGEAVIVWEPDSPIPFSEGDNVGIEVGPHGTTAGTGDISIEAEVQVTDIEKA